MKHHASLIDSSQCPEFRSPSPAKTIAAITQPVTSPTTINISQNAVLLLVEYVRTLAVHGRTLAVRVRTLAVRVRTLAVRVRTLAVHVRTLAANHRSNTLVYLLQQTGQQQPCFQSIRIDRSIFQSCIRRRVFFTNCESTSESRCLFCCREHKTTNLRMLQRAVCTSQNEISRNIWKLVAPSPKPVDVAAHNTPSEQRNEAVLRCFCNRACTHQRSSCKSWCHRPSKVKYLFCYRLHCFFRRLTFVLKLQVFLCPGCWVSLRRGKPEHMARPPSLAICNNFAVVPIAALEPTWAEVSVCALAQVGVLYRVLGTWKRTLRSHALVFLSQQPAALALPREVTPEQYMVVFAKMT